MQNHYTVVFTKQIELLEKIMRVYIVFFAGDWNRFSENEYEPGISYEIEVGDLGI